MKNACGKYSSEDISKFVDNELSEDKSHALEQHLSTCETCHAATSSFISMSEIFTSQTDKQIAFMDTDRIAHRLHSEISEKEKSTSGNYFKILGKHMVLKLASLSVILMISLFAFQNTIFSPAGPSAIVKSVDTDFASVMIIETQKEKHTIIWFNET